MMLSRLLVGDDGSPGAATARTWAEAVAGAAGAEIITATAGDRYSERPPVRSGGQAEVHELVGPPAPALLRFADEIRADLVVVGRRGAGGFEALRLGSTAHQVAEHATRPVAVIPAPARAIGGGWPFATVAVGHDGSAVAAAAMSWAVPVVTQSSATVIVVHALELAPMFAAAGLVEGYEQARARISRAVEEWCAPLREAGVAHITVVEEGGPAGVLLDAVERHEADLLIVGRRALPPFPGMSMGSAAHRVLGFARCPTVVVPGAG